jgi:hypothetical protein
MIIWGHKTLECSFSVPTMTHGLNQGEIRASPWVERKSSDENDQFLLFSKSCSSLPVPLPGSQTNTMAALSERKLVGAAALASAALTPELLAACDRAFLDGGFLGKSRASSLFVYELSC